MTNLTMYRGRAIVESYSINLKRSFYITGKTTHTSLKAAKAHIDAKLAAKA